MTTDPELLKLLVETFTVELAEQTQDMIASLLQLEQASADPAAAAKLIATIFRAAHNIKGAAKGVGITSVGEIAHQLEDIFAAVRKNTLVLQPGHVNVILAAVDNMRAAMNAFRAGSPLNFSIEECISSLASILTAAPPHTIASSTPPNATATPTPTPSNVVAIPTPAPSVTGAVPAPAAPAAPTLPSESKSTDSIRVNIDHIDRVSALMEEIQVNKISLDDHVSTLDQVLQKSRHLQEFFQQQAAAAVNVEVINDVHDRVADLHHGLQQLQQHFRANLNELSALTHALHDEIRRLRLVPAAHMLQTLPRFVRELTQELQKEARLQLQGEDVKMDKLILEGLHDPLLHLLRNAIDHGIEDPATRARAGKNKMATLTLKIIDEGNEVVLVCSDDGAGIDVEKIKQCALQKNLLTTAEAAALGADEILQLIFRPGFSTKEIITSISGRGVGLDVVKSNLTALKGSVKVTCEPGLGTTFYLRVPLTLTSERGLIVRSGNTDYVLPLSAVSRVLTGRRADVRMVAAEAVMLFEQQPVVVRTLGEILQTPVNTASSKDELFIVMVKKDWQSLALLVDDIIGEREIVVKPLPEPLQDLPCVAGGTLASTGQVILVLHIGDLIQRGLACAFQTHAASAHLPGAPGLPQGPPHILVVDDFYYDAHAGTKRTGK